MTDNPKTTAESPLDERIEKLSDAIGISADILWRGANDVRQMQTELKAARMGHEGQQRNTQAFMLERDKARACLAFFASVIKSGESWSATCEAEYRKAMQND